MLRMPTGAGRRPSVRPNTQFAMVAALGYFVGSGLALAETLARRLQPCRRHGMAWEKSVGRQKSDRGTAMRSSHVLASTVVLIRTTDNANRYGPGRDEAFRPSVGRRDLMAPDWILQGAFISSVSDLANRRWRLRRTAGKVSVEILFY